MAGTGVPKLNLASIGVVTNAANKTPARSGGGYGRPSGGGGGVAQSRSAPARAPASTRPPPPAVKDAAKRPSGGASKRATVSVHKAIAASSTRPKPAAQKAAAAPRPKKTSVVMAQPRPKQPKQPSYRPPPHENLNMAVHQSVRKTHIDRGLRRPDAHPGSHNAHRPDSYNGAPWKMHVENEWRHKMDHDKNGKPDRDTASKFYKTAAKGNPAAEKREKQVMGGTGRTASEVDMLHHRRRVEAAGGRVDTRPPRSLHMSRPLPGKNSAEKRRSSIGGSAAGSSGVVRGGGSNVGCSEPRTRPSLGANPSVTGAYLEAATRTASWAQDVQQARAESVNMAKVWFRVSGGGAEVDGAYVYDRESQHGPVYRNEFNRKWKLGKGALKETVGRGSVHTIDHDVEGPALFDNHAKPPATGWYLYTIQGWRVAYKVLQTTLDGFETDRRPERMKMWPPPSGRDLRPRKTNGDPTSKAKHQHLDERWVVHGSRRARRQSGRKWENETEEERSDSLRIELVDGTAPPSAAPAPAPGASEDPDAWDPRGGHPGSTITTNRDHPHDRTFERERFAETRTLAQTRTMPPSGSSTGGPLSGIAEMRARNEAESPRQNVRTHSHFDATGQSLDQHTMPTPDAARHTFRRGPDSHATADGGAAATLRAQTRLGAMSTPTSGSAVASGGTPVGQDLSLSDLDRTALEASARDTGSGRPRDGTLRLSDPSAVTVESILSEATLRRLQTTHLPEMDDLLGETSSAHESGTPTPATELDYTVFMSLLVQEAVRLDATNDAELRGLFERKIRDEVESGGTARRADGTLRTAMDERTLRLRVSAMASDLGVAMDASSTAGPHVSGETKVWAAARSQPSLDGGRDAPAQPTPRKRTLVTPRTIPRAYGSEAEDTLCVLMLHATRLDTAVPFDELSTDAWPDKLLRPHDPPIANDGIAERSFFALEQWLGPARRVDRIVCSPFRRCLHTAAAAVRILGVRDVCIDNRIGESSRVLLADFRAANVHPVDIGAKKQYIAQSEAAAILGPGVALQWDRAQHPYDLADDIGASVEDAVREASTPGSGNFLLITHDDVFQQLLPQYVGDLGRYVADPSGWLVMRGPHGARARADAVVKTHLCTDLAGPSAQDSPFGM